MPIDHLSYTSAKRNVYALDFGEPKKNKHAETMQFAGGLRKQNGPDEVRISCPEFFFIFALSQILVNFDEL